MSRTKHNLSDEWWSQDMGPEQPVAHWELGWNDELATFYGRLVMDYERGELGEGEDPEEEVVAFSCGDRPGQFIHVDQLEAAIGNEVDGNLLPGDMVAKLEADRDVTSRR